MYPKTLMLLGSGELGKEFAIAAKRLGCKVIACDRYAGAPAMQLADASEVLDMTDPELLQKVIRSYMPDAVVPEIEALAVDALTEIEEEGIRVIPTAKATRITMNRDKVRDLAAIKLGLKTAKYAYASNIAELQTACESFGIPLLIKPVMSSSGKGQSLVKSKEELGAAFSHAMSEARGKSNQVIIEDFIDFDLEITLLTIRQKDGTTLFCDPIGHEQVNGDYQCSWQPAEISEKLLKKAQIMAKEITDELGGTGLYGVEFFISKDEVIFSELSPRPHDTGLVTLISQNLSEFELHLRAILGIPIPTINTESPSASRVITANVNLSNFAYLGLENALELKNTKIYLFGKPNTKIGRRMGVALAKAETCKKARYLADKAASYVDIIALS